jgi:hypothetical protein
MTATDSAVEVRTLRASHRRVIQLFRTYGPMTDAEAYEAAKADGWQISPSGLRSRRAEVSPPRGAGIRNTGQRRKSALGTSSSVVWELDPTVTEPFAGRAS